MAKPLTTRALDLVTPLSLLALATLAAAWAASYCDGVYSDRGRVLVVGAADAEEFSRFADGTYQSRDATVWHELRENAVHARLGSPSWYPSSPPPVSAEWGGFAFHRADYHWSRGHSGSSTGRLRYWLLAVPYWALCLPAAVAPAVRLARRARATRRRRFGLCPACSYDLTGNTSGLCPECGTAVPKGVTK